jgi:arylformamidase
MISAKIDYKGFQFEIDLDEPIDISIPVGRDISPNAFYLQVPEYSTVASGNFIGDVNKGGSCNVENILFSPHGNGTHTECAGHINKEHLLVNNLLKRHFFLAGLISTVPADDDSGYIIDKEQISEAWPETAVPVEAIIIRTHPNSSKKFSAVYGGTNPPYISKDAIEFLNDKKIKHLLTDLPSIDREDDGKLIAHHSFFNLDNDSSSPKTITEMIYASNEVEDGLYWLDLQIAGFESDASPSKPILYKTRLMV